MIPMPTHTLPRTDFHAADHAAHPFEQALDFKTFSSLRRMVSHQHHKPLFKRADFMKQITLYLPEVAARIEENDFGIMHLEIGAMKLVTREAFARSDFTTVSKHLQLIAELFERADTELYEAIRISYLEALFLGENSAAHSVARGMLSRTMAHVLRQAELRLAQQREAAK